MTEEEKQDPFRPPTAEHVIRYRKTLKDHVESVKTKLTVKTRKDIDARLTDQSAFQEQANQFKKAMSHVLIMLVVFIVSLYFLLPQYLLYGLFTFPLFVLMAHFVVSKRRGRASENLQKPKLSKGLPPPPPPPPLSSSVASPIVPKIKKARLQKLESETLTIILLAVSTLMSLIFYGTVYFMPFFVALLIFYAAYLIQVKFTTLSKQDLNVPEAERLLVSVKDQKCFSCGSVEKNVSTRATHSSIFGEGTEIQLTCKGCGTITIWKKGKLTKKTP